MRPRFPGMDPWLEHPGLWAEVHHRLSVAIADELGSKVAPSYFIEIKRQTYVASSIPNPAAIPPDVRVRTDGVIEMDVDVPVPVAFDGWSLEIRTVEKPGKAVTVIELLSPASKAPGAGRRKYLRKRNQIFRTRANLVEIDLLRAGRPMPIASAGPVERPYRILISRGASRPRAKLMAFGVRDEIPTIPIPLLPDDPEPTLSLGAVLHALYDRARFDLQLNYKEPPVPPLDPDDAAWARDILASG